jgi:hypothetical protein
LKKDRQIFCKNGALVTTLPWASVFAFLKNAKMVLCLPFLGLLPWYYHAIFYEIFLKIMVKNGNRLKNWGKKWRLLW